MQEREAARLKAPAEPTAPQAQTHLLLVVPQLAWAAEQEAPAWTAEAVCPSEASAPVRTERLSERCEHRCSSEKMRRHKTASSSSLAHLDLELRRKARIAAASRGDDQTRRRECTQAALRNAGLPAHSDWRGPDVSRILNSSSSVRCSTVRASGGSAHRHAAQKQARRARHTRPNDALRAPHLVRGHAAVLVAVGKRLCAHLLDLLSIRKQLRRSG